MEAAAYVLVVLLTCALTAVSIWLAVGVRRP